MQNLSVEVVLSPKPNALLDMEQGGDAGQLSNVSANRNCLELDLFLEEEPTPLLCCLAIKYRGKTGKRSLEWVLQLVKDFSHLVQLSCDGYEGKLSALFADIIASNTEQDAGSSSCVGKKGMRELNNLFNSINYDVHSGSISRAKNKWRDQRGFLRSLFSFRGTLEG